ncbi:MAG: hypothetical protein WA125_04690 [Desulfosporosinus sp.]
MNGLGQRLETLKAGSRSGQYIYSDSSIEMKIAALFEMVDALLDERIIELESLIAQEEATR